MAAGGCWERKTRSPGALLAVERIRSLHGSDRDQHLHRSSGSVRTIAAATD